MRFEVILDFFNAIEITVREVKTAPFGGLALVSCDVDPVSRRAELYSSAHVGRPTSTYNISSRHISSSVQRM